MHITLASLCCDTEICINLFAPIIQNGVPFPFPLIALLSVLYRPCQRGAIIPTFKPPDFGWRSCVNVLPVWQLGESNFLLLHNVFHYESHLLFGQEDDYNQ